MIKYFGNLTSSFLINNLGILKIRDQQSKTIHKAIWMCKTQQMDFSSLISNNEGEKTFIDRKLFSYRLLCNSKMENKVIQNFHG